MDTVSRTVKPALKGAQHDPAKMEEYERSFGLESTEIGGCTILPARKRQTDLTFGTALLRSFQTLLRMFSLVTHRRYAATSNLPHKSQTSNLKPQTSILKTTNPNLSTCAGEPLPSEREHNNPGLELLNRQHFRGRLYHFLIRCRLDILRTLRGVVEQSSLASAWPASQVLICCERRVLGYDLYDGMLGCYAFVSV